jgi:hypothetical protein
MTMLHWHLRLGAYFVGRVTRDCFGIPNVNRPQLAKSDRSIEQNFSCIPQTTIANTFLILGNKIDVEGAVSKKEELKQVWGLWQMTGKRKVPLEGIRPIEVLCGTFYISSSLASSSIVMRQGYGGGVRWLSQYV